MIAKTKGIVLRIVKYGETSLVVTVFTELFGLQSYMVNGVRTTSKKGTSKASLFQPSAILELVAYHNEFNNLQRLREYKWDFLYQHILSDVRKNAVAMFMVELLIKCLKQPEPNPDLFYFVEDALHHLDKANDAVTGNYPLFFALHLAVFFGLRINDEFSTEKHYLDLQEGVFTDLPPHHTNYLDETSSAITDRLQGVSAFTDLEKIELNKERRRNMLYAYLEFYRLHLPDFTELQSPPILHEILG